jgi:phosphatidate cytidylyltransferase
LNNTLVRVIVGMIGIPVIIFLIILGNIYFLIFAIVVSAFCMNEFYNLFERAKKPPGLLTKWIGGFNFEKLIFISVSSLIVLSFYFEKINFVLILFFLMFIYLIIAELAKKVKHFESIGTWILAIFYISIPFGLSALMASSKFVIMFGANYTLITIIMIWVSDTFAFWGGKSFGKHKLAPSISPKKTWEGSAFGIIFTIITGLVMYIFCDQTLGLLNILIISVIVGLTAQIGDLFESHLKRSAEVKDSSQLIPGHGGVLDRFDSLLFSIPAVYIYLYLTKLYTP